MQPADIARALREGLPLRLPAKRTAPTPAQRAALDDYLARAYRREAQTWTPTAPPFDAAAARAGYDYFVHALYDWHAGNLAPVDLDADTDADAGHQVDHPHVPAAHAPSTALSADPTLRYLPPLIARMRAQDPDAAEAREHRDRLLANAPLTALLLPDFDLPADFAADLAPLLEHPTTRALVVDRVIARRHGALAATPPLRDDIAAALGAHAAEFWPSFAGV